MIIIVALLLSFVSTILKPFQLRNIREEKMKEILLSAQIDCGLKAVDECYNEYVIEERVISTAKADVVSVFSNGKFQKGNLRAFDLNLKEELDKASKNQEALLPLYVIRKENNKLNYVVPLLGKGLWGPIWGSIALEDDFNTIAGVVFNHKGETPGLGAEIATADFQKKFKGKQILNQKGEFVSVKLVKGGLSNNRSINPIHGVDAITGGTITSDGVSNMLFDCLKNYLPYFNKIRSYEK